MSKIYGGDDKYDSTIKGCFFFPIPFYNRDDNFSLLLTQFSHLCDNISLDFHIPLMFLKKNI